MRLFIGPPACGKTAQLVAAVRSHLARQNCRFRLLVPTATMAEHFRNVLVREGFLLRPSSVLTFSKFLEPWAAATDPVPSVSLHLLVEDILARLPLDEFQEVKTLPGFRDALVAWIEEFSAAGADALMLESLGLNPSLVAVFRQVEQELAARRQALRRQRLRDAALAIRSSGLKEIDSIYLDGFLSFPAPELEVLESLVAHTDLAVTLPEWEGSARARAALRRMGLREETLPAAGKPANRVLVSAPNLEQEVEEICRRILAANRPFREIGILVRNTGRYLPALRNALARFGIPSRFYVAEPLISHPLVRYFSALVESAQCGWEHPRLIEALTMNYSGLGGTAKGDRLEFQLREGLPARGLELVRPLAGGDPRIEKILANLDAFGRSLDGFAPAGEWVSRLAALRGTLHIPRPQDSVPHEQALLGRAQAAAVRAFETSLTETAAALGSGTLLDFDGFWQKAKIGLSLTTLRVPDHRHNVVHVLDAWEARQWSLPVMFVCGLLEGEFPAYPNEEPLVPDAERVRLAAAGLAVKTMSDRQKEEEFLWRMASTRASEELVLTYPRFNDMGEATLPSFHLGADLGEPRPAVPVRPASPRSRVITPGAVILDEELQGHIAGRNPHWRPTAVESFLQCPFQFFSRYTLRLRGAPAKPEDRLDRLAQGNVIHGVLAEWHRSQEQMSIVFDRFFESFCHDQRVREGYASEMARLEMVRNLDEFLRNPRLQTGWQVLVEEGFELDLEPGIRVRGRIDRFDVSPDGRVRLVDYKYSSAAGLAKRFQQPDADRYVQGGLYLLALSEKYAVESFHYCGLKGGAHWKGWNDPVSVRQLMEQARQLTVQAAHRVAAGDIAVNPWSPDGCVWCDYRDACRVKELPAVREAGEDQ